MINRNMEKENSMRIQDIKPVSYVCQLRCDRCGAEAQHDVYEGFNNFLQIDFDTSWGSAIGDGTHVELDFCHSCLKRILGQWLRLSPAAWNRLPQLEDAADSAPLTQTE